MTDLKEKFGNKEKHKRMPHEDGGLNDASKSQGIPKTLCKPQKARRRQGRISLQFSEGAWTLPTP